MEYDFQFFLNQIESIYAGGFVFFKASRVVSILDALDPQLVKLQNLSFVQHQTLRIGNTMGRKKEERSTDIF